MTAEPMTATGIAGHLEAMRAAGVGYWPDATEAEYRAALSVWLEALQAIPAPFVDDGMRYWATTMSRRPSPGDIANIARQRIGDASARIRRESEAHPDPVQADEAEVERRRAMAARLAEAFPMLRKVSE